MQQSKPKQQSKQSKSGAGTVRIIGGSMRGRKIRFSGADGLRPTLDRVRETVFNWLARDIAGSDCLDLFTGSGALSFEALSRGAGSVVMVEKNRKVAEALKVNCQSLNIQAAKVVNLDADKFLRHNSQKFDLVFLDPPFGKGLMQQTIDSLKPHLKSNALVYIEQEKSDQEYIPDDSFEPLKSKKTGSFSYSLYRFL
ncbi:16S rRNA (guanine(966)-N(2))-methyltransferase RsmD [Aliikangiella marina]|uniref:Ribosomal RNA small subunit methyltransferase D n=1 Tax=Aliikangiella marina TaxID=1712262 RepID=A0A545T4Z2_9GAMM|nr:16S rRNA (guanine(966)-N(2))-methyltransferase RsmD [Aliikangiella marina]TQV72286.1 16S rRNA (guanine(966)-N(2))-methyltransferase RsmD [Aliikangiella marina]